MADTMDIVKLAVDTYKGNIAGNFSMDESMDTLRNALVAANNGSDRLDYRAIRDGECKGLFRIIEEIVSKTVIEGLQGNEFFMNLVEYKNLKLGDKNSFYVPDDSLFFVADTARGTQGVRRQRLNGGTTFDIKTSFKTVKFYEELDRVLAGRISLNDFIDVLNRSFTKKNLDDIYAAFTGITKTAGSKYLPTAGTYSEAALLEMIDHIEAANGQKATIMGTRQALRKLTTAVQSTLAEDDMYNLGYYGKFNGTPMVCLNQIHKTGTDDFLLPNNEIYVFAGPTKPIKYVTEGQDTIIMNTQYANQDLTQDYLYGSQYGVGVIISEKFGIYTMSS